MNFIQRLKRLYYTDFQYYRSFPKRLFRTKTRTNGRVLYLHVGMDKTGTSAIQAFLHLNESRLYSSEGILRPSTSLWGDYSHHALAFSLLEISGYTKKDLIKYLDSLQREIQTASRIILSSECLFKTTQHKNFSYLKKFIDVNFSDIRIIVYVRRQDEWIESRHKHSILSGQTLSLKQLSKDHFCNYKKFIDLWRDSFPSAQIIVRPYEKGQFKDGNIFSDFASLLDITSIDDYSYPAKEVNSSLDNVTTEFKALCNSIGFHGRAEHQLNVLLLKYTQLQKGKQKSYPMLSPEVRQLLLQRYSVCNNDIAREYLSGNKELFQAGPPLSDSEWVEYKGLSPDEAREISSFIERENPNLSKELQNQIDLSLKSDVPLEQSAAKQLQSLIFYKK